MTLIQDGSVVFQLQCPDATWASVCGDFNNWSAQATPMREVRPGVWEARVKLEPGEYRFRYQTSNRGWLTDWSAGGVQKNPYGDWDSLLMVPLPASAAARSPDTAAEDRMLRRAARGADAARRAEPRSRSDTRLAGAAGAI